MIGLLVVFLQEDNGILALGHFKVLQHTGLLAGALAGTEGIGLEAVRYLALGQCVDMDGDEEVSLVLIGYLCPSVQLHELVCLTGIDHIHVGTVLLYQSSEGQGHTQGQCLLIHLTALSPGIPAPMSGIDDKCEPLACSIGRHRKQQGCYHQ